MGAALVCLAALAAEPDTLTLRTGTVLRGEFVAVEKKGRGCVVRFRVEGEETTLPPSLAQRIRLGDGTIITVGPQPAPRPASEGKIVKRARVASAAPAPKPRREKPLLAARVGEYWRVQDDDIVLFREPEIPASREAFRRAVVAPVPRDADIEVLRQQGILSPWLYVRLGKPGTDGGVRGWLLPETVRAATRTARSMLSSD